MRNGDIEMSNYSDLSIDQIRNALNMLEDNYSLAMDSEAFGLAGAFKSKIDSLMAELTKRITAEDPYTTEEIGRAHV